MAIFRAFRHFLLIKIITLRTNAVINNRSGNRCFCLAKIIHSFEWHFLQMSGGLATFLLNILLIPNNYSGNATKVTAAYQILYYKNRTCSVFKRDQRRARVSWPCRELPAVSGTRCQQQAQLTEITTSNCIKDEPTCTSPRWMLSWAPNGAMREKARWWTCWPPRWT